MTHKYDVIYTCVNEGIQKTKNKDHSKLVLSKSKLMKFFIITNKKAFNGVFDFSTELFLNRIQFLKIFTDDVIAYLSDQKWSGSSKSVISTV